MPWYFYVVAFVAGMLLANGVPHFVQGISGNPFQSPFAKPPGVGESSPRVNVVWGFANVVAGVLLKYFFWPYSAPGWVMTALGALALALVMAGHFGKVRAEKQS
jgi:hypothetical protein